VLSGAARLRRARPQGPENPLATLC